MGFTEYTRCSDLFWIGIRWRFEKGVRIIDHIKIQNIEGAVWGGRGKSNVFFWTRISVPPPSSTSLAKKIVKHSENILINKRGKGGGWEWFLIRNYDLIISLPPKLIKTNMMRWCVEMHFDNILFDHFDGKNLLRL